MKRVLLFSMFFIVFFVSACSNDTFQNTEKNAVPSVGDVVEFGTYEQDNITSNSSEPISWNVLNIVGNEALLLANDLIDCCAYNSQEKNMTWEKCTLRAWLNSTFLESAFSPEEQSCIIAHTIVNESIEQKYIKEDGSIRKTAEPLPGCSVDDKVFLLSVDELHQYFSTNESRIANPTPCVILKADDAFKWWTRTPGSIADNPKFVDEKGSTDIGGGLCTLSMGIRPAIWVTLGAGHVTLNQKSDVDSDSRGSSSSGSQKTSTCNYCSGTGKVDGKTCPWCNGSGKTYNNMFNDLLG